MKRFIEVATITLLAGSTLCHFPLGFSPNPQQHILPHGSQNRRKVFNALIFGGEEFLPEEYEPLVLSETSSIDGVFSKSTKTSIQLMEDLSKKCTSSLIRLACAFAPSHHSLRPKNLESAHLINMDDKMIEISAVLCDSSGCVQVPVPVQLPCTCENRENIEMCLLNNIEVLDKQAQHLIEQEEISEDNGEDNGEQNWMLASLAHDPAPRELPVWWQFPGLDNGLAKDCMSIKSILNEDHFSEELTTLALQQLKVDMRYPQVTKVCVASIGPAGLLLRARVEPPQSSSSNHFDFVLLGIQFSQNALTLEDLRSSVLSLVSSSGSITS